MARALTTKAVEAAKPDPERRREIPDPALTGLYLVVQPSGAKSWAVRYRHRGKPKKLTLGRWPLMTVAQARGAATEALEAVEQGDDPSATKKASKAARAADPDRDTVRALVEQFDRRHLSKLRSGRDVRRKLDAHVVPRWGDRDVHEITRRDVLDLLDAIADAGTPTTANRIRAFLSKFFAWCVERDIIEASPVAGVRAVTKEAPRDRVLSDDEVRWLWQATAEAGQPFGPLARMLLLTGQRLGEVAAMTDDEVTGATWHLSADRTKNARAHDVPLSEAARDVLRGVERVKGREGYIFTTTGETPVSGFSRARGILHAKMEAIAGKERGEPVEIPHWTFHDLRRTAATGMARLGVPVRVTEAVLNHVSGTGAGIVAVYQRHDYADEKRQALEALGCYVAALVDGASDKVVPMARAAR